MNAGYLITGTHSGVGKTTVTLALMGLWTQQGYQVQPFKIGPDFIDGSYHQWVTGHASVNLDLWMMGWKGIQTSFQKYSKQAQISLVEGMGAIFDGQNGTLKGSSAIIAKRLKIPIILVVDVWGMTKTTEAILEGIRQFDPSILWAGVILNRVGSYKHYEMILRSLNLFWRRKIWGYLIKTADFEISERHLGLIMPKENVQVDFKIRALLNSTRQTLRLPKNGLALSRPSKKIPAYFSKMIRSKICLGVARDAAFCFYYEANLKMLEAAGAQLIFFSPLRDKKLPSSIDGLYLGGGYPENFLKELSSNDFLKKEIRACVMQGMPVYAECGGLMYLSRTLIGQKGKAYSMVSILPITIQMNPSHLVIRYVEVQTTQKTLLGSKGTIIRGHEFHQSEIISNAFLGKALYQGMTSMQQKFTEGFCFKNLVASYIHLHFQSNPMVPMNWVNQCLKFRQSF
jgi:cobyrinic acid a,c-diamide synthase